MLKKLLFVFVIVLASSHIAFAQVGQGTIKGKITNGDDGEPVPFANVTLYDGVEQLMGTTTDFDGNYTLKPIPSGSYDIQVSYVGFQTKRISGISVSSDKITKQDIPITQGVELKEVEVIEYVRPLIEIDKTSTEKVMTRDEIEKMAVRDVNDISKTTGNGVFSRDDGTGSLNVRGQRSGSNVTFIDGVKVIGSTNLPKSAIEEVTVKTGGLSAQYGDVTGAVRTITTRGTLKEYFGSVELLSSGFKSGEEVYGLDNYGFNIFGFAVGGPVYTKKDEEGNVKEAPVSFLLTGEFRSELDPRPSAVSIFKPKDAVEQEIRQNPYIFDESNNVLLKRAEFLRRSDFEEIDYQRNAQNKTIVLNGKIDVKVSDLSTLAFGGTVNLIESNNYNRNFSLFNYQNNSVSDVNDYRVWGRYTQRFANEKLEEGQVDKSVVKNAFFSIQADFSRRAGVTQDRNHEDNFFDYGYVGQFDAVTTLSYDDGVATLNDGRTYVGRFLTAFDAPISYDFTPGNKNPVLTNYTNDFYRYIPEGDPRRLTREQVEGNGGIVNGGNVTGSIFNMWSPPGQVSNGYSKFENDQIRLSGRGSADIGDHAIILGFEYEQRVQRSYSMNPRALWNLGRLTVNSHILQIDSNNYSISYQHPNPVNPTITFERLYGGDDQRTNFAYYVRQALGLDPSGTSFIDFDSYDPDLYKISYFAADQLMNPANNVNLFTRGYSTTGNKLPTSTTLDDFFEARDQFGRRTRPVAPYEPIYIAGYIEDKFAIDDLVFRVGLRLDRFDANQPVLKDPFSFFPTRNVAYVKSLANAGSEYTPPSNIGDDFIVYVNDIEDPNIGGIIGYRDPNTDRFFNAAGQELNDPSVLQAGSRIAPWLQAPGDVSTVEDMNSSSFEDYTPQYTLMPRISFSFPISDEATFFASYDIKTIRPGGQNVLEPINLVYVANLRPNTIINNPNLLPTRTISYEIGFKQKLTNHSAITLSANYNEQRDEIQVRKLVGAFPQDYLTYDNIDFGTVKGFTVDYDLRRIKNVSIRLNYTLQFAEGTGSGSVTSLNLVNSNQPNLRTIFPYSYDQRHQIITTFDYRYGMGREYNGPKVNGKNILENTGLNVVFIAGSGTPYTARSLAGSSELLNGSQTVQPVVGDVNGSRLPWTLRVDARLDKSFDINWGDKNETNEALWKKGKKQSVLNVYLQVLNVLNRQNVQNVYGFTGNPDDDGYLNAPQFQDQIRNVETSEASFRDLYSFRLMNPFNFELPRRIRLGAQLSF